MPVCCQLLIVAAVAAGQSRGALPGRVFQEKHGLVVVEIESSPVDGDWVRETEQTGFKGTAYYRLDGNGYAGGGRNGILKYKVLIVSRGIWYFTVRGSRGYPKDPTWSNDIFLRMVDYPGVQNNYNKVFGGKVMPAWGWTGDNADDPPDLNPVRFDLTPGVYELHVAGRSGGYRIDRFVLYNREMTGKFRLIRGDSRLDNAPESRSGPSLGELKHNPRMNICADQGAFGLALKEAGRAKSSGGDKGEEARTAEAAILQYADALLKDIEKIKSSDPLAATRILSHLASQFSGSDKGRELTAQARAWSKEPAVADAAKADRIFEQLKVAAKNVRRGNLSDAVFRRRYRRQITTIAQYVAFLKKKYPGTSGCRKAEAFAGGLGIDGL